MTFTPRQMDRLTDAYRHILDVVQPDWKTNPHMMDTPARSARWWDEFINYEEGTVDTTFPVQQVDQMVAVRGIETWSLCAHHLLPFSASVSIGYIADSRVLGLSKFARIAHSAAHTPTSQEELCDRIASRVIDMTGTEHVAVTASGLHLCMAMRGIKTPAIMHTSVTRGAFRDDPAARAEWFALLSRP